MTERPADTEAVVAAVRAAAAAGTPLELLGGGSKRGIGHRGGDAQPLDLSGLRGITLYAPNELVLSARAGTPLAEVEAALAEEGQRLPFEPPDWRALLGTAETTPTIGGTVAANASGPARLVAGACRDLLLGVKAVNGRAEEISSGGRVMKNVTGYDLCKLLAGSWGTLAALTEVTFKVLPRPEAAATLAFPVQDAAEAVVLLSRAMATPYEVDGAAYLPADIAARSGVGGIADAGSGLALTRIENFAASIDYRAEKLAGALGAPVLTLRDADSARLWRELRDAAYFAGMSGPVWRISVKPTAAPGLVAGLRETRAFEAFHDWAGGLVWLRLAEEDPEAARAVTAAVAATGGHATLLRAGAELRAAAAAFQPADPVTARLSAGLKAAFDPQGLFNPGRMTGTAQAA